jgi:hypothetical protein
MASYFSAGTAFSLSLSLSNKCNKDGISASVTYVDNSTHKL